MLFRSHRSDVGEADLGEDLPGVGPVQGGRLLQLARHRQQGRVQDDRVQAQEPPSLRDRDRRQDREPALSFVRNRRAVLLCVRFQALLTGTFSKTERFTFAICPLPHKKTALKPESFPA